MASVKLLLREKSNILMIRKRRGFTQKTWANSAHISESTLKRFWRGKSVSVDTFSSLCHALGIQEWQHVDWDEKDSAQVVSTFPFLPETELASKSMPAKSPSFVVAILSENQKLEIEAIVEQLNSLFATCTNITLPTQDMMVNLSDIVGEHKKLEAETVIENLKSLLKDCTITLLATHLTNN